MMKNNMNWHTKFYTKWATMEKLPEISLIALSTKMVLISRWVLNKLLIYKKLKIIRRRKKPLWFILKDGRLTSLIVIALQRANSVQKEQLKENYGLQDENNAKIVKQVKDICGNNWVKRNTKVLFICSNFFPRFMKSLNWRKPWSSILMKKNLTFIAQFKALPNWTKLGWLLNFSCNY